MNNNISEKKFVASSDTIQIHENREYDIRVRSIAALVILLLTGSATAATPISSCTTISSPGEYVLIADIIDSSSATCIAITSEDVVFDGADHIIDGMDIVNQYGIFAYDSTGVLTKVRQSSGR